MLEDACKCDEAAEETLVHGSPAGSDTQELARTPEPHSSDTEPSGQDAAVILTDESTDESRAQEDPSAALPARCESGRAAAARSAATAPARGIKRRALEEASSSDVDEAASTGVDEAASADVDDAVSRYIRAKCTQRRGLTESEALVEAKRYKRLPLPQGYRGPR